MTRLLDQAAVLLGSGWLVLAHGQSPAPAPPPAPQAVQASIGRVALASIANDHLQFSIALSLLADRDVDLSQIRISGLRLNGLPLFSAPTPETVHLTAHQAAAMPHPLAINLYFRDLDTLQPVTDLLTQGRATIEGTLSLAVGLNLAEKVFLKSNQGQVVVPFRNEVALQFPAGDGLRSAAESAVATANTILTTASADADSALGMIFSERRALNAHYRDWVLPVRTHFELDDPKGGHQSYVRTGMGLRIGGNRIIVLKQLIRPWEFDPDLATKMQQRHFQIPASGYDVSVGAFSEGRGQLRLVRLAKDDTQTILAPQSTGLPARTRVGRADSAGNLALLEITGTAASVTSSADAPTLDAGNSQVMWNDLGVYRWVSQGGGEGGGGRTELLLLAAGRDGDAFHLNTPLDEGAFGSPLIGPAGIVGIIQSEAGAIGVAAALKALGLGPIS
ncbi:MAG TPA: hypothetical protein VIC32_00670 [Terriglobales bacterium]